ncbi:hypothetical protein D3C74_418210 [compost metagenome]
MLASTWEQRLNRRECGTDGLLLASHHRRSTSSVRGYSCYVETGRDLAHHCDGNWIDLRSDEYFLESIVAAGSHTIRGYHPWYTPSGAGIFHLLRAAGVPGYAHSGDDRGYYCDQSECRSVHLGDFPSGDQFD